MGPIISPGMVHTLAVMGSLLENEHRGSSLSRFESKESKNKYFSHCELRRKERKAQRQAKKKGR